MENFKISKSKLEKKKGPKGKSRNKKQNVKNKKII